MKLMSMIEQPMMRKMAMLMLTSDAQKKFSVMAPSKMAQQEATAIGREWQPS